MKRRTEFLVEKRDGRRVWLRMSRLAHSIYLAMQNEGVHEPWQAMDLASSVVAGLRSVHGHRAVLSTPLLADAVSRVLHGSGLAAAAVAYERVGAEHRRRRYALSPAGAQDGWSPTASGFVGIVGRPPLADPPRA